MDPKSTLRRFARNGAVIEGRGLKVAAVAAVLLALGAGHAAAAPRGPGFPAPTAAQHQAAAAERARLETAEIERMGRVPDMPTMGILHAGKRRYAAPPAMPPSGANPDNFRPDKAAVRHRAAKPVTIDYSGLVKDIRAQVEAEFPGKIYVVDRSRPVETEAKRVAGIVGMPPSPRDAEAISGDPHSIPAVGLSKGICVVVGAEPQLTARDMTAGYVEEALSSKDSLAFKAGAALDDAAMHRLLLWHEVGHCLLGGSEAKADAFAVLKTMNDLKRTDFVDFAIAVRELMERTSSPDDDHVISPTLRRAVAAHANAAFMSRAGAYSLRELGTMADALDITPDVRTVRIRNWTAMSRFDPVRRRFDPDRRYLVPVKEGFAVTDFAGWLKASAKVPEFRRVGDLLAWVQADPATRGPLPAFHDDPKASAQAISELAAAGDPVARRLLPVFEAPPASSDRAVTPAADLPSQAEVGGRLIAFDRSNVAVKFSMDDQSFLLRDAGTGAPVAAGDTANGITRTFSGPQPVRTAKAAPQEERWPAFRP